MPESVRTQTSYEKSLGYNAITRHLHGSKYQTCVSDMMRRFGDGRLPTDRPLRVLDLGCGPATVFDHLKAFLDEFEYFGIDPDAELVAAAKARYGDDERFTIVEGVGETHLEGAGRFDVIICFDAFEHMPMPVRMRQIEQLAALSFSVLYANVPNEVGPAILIKNLGSALMGYSRHKEYTLAETINSALGRLDHVPVHVNAHKGFDWRHLHHMLRFFFETSIRTSPIRFIPRWTSPSIFFICEPTQR